ncbi:MAG: MFS transporter [Halioglobus sp.]
MPAPDDSPADREQPSKWLVLFIVAMNGFLIILDFSIVNISSPVLTSVFETDISLVLWVTVAFALIPAGLMPVFGKLADILGQKKIFLVGFTIFTAGLILCSFAQSIHQLIFFRLIQGVGAAMNMAVMCALLTPSPNQLVIGAWFCSKAI